MKRYIIFCAFVSFSLNFTIPPQNEADHLLLNACKNIDSIQIMHALCWGANKEVTDERGRDLHTLMKGDDERQALAERSIELTDSIASCYQALSKYPEALIEDFELVDRMHCPRNCSFNLLRLGLVNGIDYQGDTIIHRAIRVGEPNDNVIKKIIGLRGWLNWKLGVIDERNNDGDTPLHLVMKSSTDIRNDESRRRLCLFLVSRGANAAIKNKKGETPITYDVHFWLSLCSSMKQSEGLCSKINRLLFCRKKAA